MPNTIQVTGDDSPFLDQENDINVAIDRSRDLLKTFERRFICPVCAYPKLTNLPVDHEICPSCGTEFGLDDYEKTHAQLREEWEAAGKPWFSQATKPWP